jgi:bacteriorhodopsin
LGWTLAPLIDPCATDSRLIAGISGYLSGDSRCEKPAKGSQSSYRRSMGLLEVLNGYAVLVLTRDSETKSSRRHILMLKLDSNQWNLIYNIFSFGLVSMLACTVYTLVSQQRVLAKYRNALVMSSMVTFIAAYHYMRIFNSFNESSADMTINISGAQGSFNEAYRYVDWLLTVPLLLVEVVAVLALTKSVSTSLITRLVPASAAMIALGYPGEISSDQNTQVMYGVLSTIPFLYILYVLFVELGKSLANQPAGVAETVGRLRLLLIATWGVYPISYILGMGEGMASAEQFVGVQVGYTVADVLAKCVFGLTILKIARMKSMAEGMKDDH